MYKKAWYEQFYDKNNPNGGTPLPEAPSRVGRHFAGKTDGINNGMPDDPIEYSCQQNFAVATTDGYWSGRNGKDASGGSIPNQDAKSGTNPPFYDGGSGARSRWHREHLQHQRHAGGCGPVLLRD